MAARCISCESPDILLPWVTVLDQLSWWGNARPTAEGRHYFISIEEHFYSMTESNEFQVAWDKPTAISILRLSKEADEKLNEIFLLSQKYLDDIDQKKCAKF